MSKETIFAPATAPGKSGVAIVRISGPQARQALILLSGHDDWTPNMAWLCTLRHPQSGGVIDRALALYFQAPHSFTGEDVAELHVHGSLAVMRELMQTLGKMDGMRPAEPGEFSRRAFLNGKMDLIEAEGLADLIDAETSSQKTQALRQMQGELSTHYDALRERIVKALAHLEAYIDFPDEEIPESAIANLGQEIELLKATITAALDDHRRGEKLRSGISVVILGAPNAGKSSLLNALAKRDAAIVSHRAGTTRDAIEVHMEIAGFPVILTDTAGLRETGDDIEEEGVKRALARAKDADLKLVLFDGGQDPDARSLALIDEDSILIISKSDIPISENLISKLKPMKSIQISTKTGAGMKELLGEIERRIASDYSGEGLIITRARHRSALEAALSDLTRLKLDAPLELTCEELRRAAASVGKITGKIAVDDILDVVFKSFCIGK